MVCPIPPYSLRKTHVEKMFLTLEFEFLPCQFQVGTSVTWIILFWCCCLIYKLKLICLVVKLLSVINKCSCFCYYHYFHIYFVICYLGDERVQIVNRCLQRALGASRPRWSGISVTVKWGPGAHCRLCEVTPVPSLPSPFNTRGCWGPQRDGLSLVHWR